MAAYFWDTAFVLSQIVNGYLLYRIGWIRGQIKLLKELREVLEAAATKGEG